MSGSTEVRHGWAAVAPAVREYVEARLGARVTRVQAGDGGYTSGMAARLTLDDGRTVFVKGVPAGHPLERVYVDETRLTAALPAAAPVPEVLWSCLPEDGPGWVLLCLADLPGGHPNLAPGSQDVPDVIAVVGQLATHLTPSPVPDAPQAVDLMGPSLACWRKLAVDTPSDLRPAAAARLDELVAIERLWEDHGRGETLLHADIRADNLMRDARGELVVIDWSCAHQGASWIEAAFLAPRLVLEGHAPAAVETLVAPLLDAVDEEPVTSLAVALAGHWEFCGRQRPMPGVPLLRELQSRTAVAAWAWAAHRLQWS